jgi:O-antigen ligase
VNQIGRQPIERLNPAIILLGCAFLFGGASQEDVIRLAVIELVAIPVLLWSVYQLWRSGDWRTRLFPIGVLLAIAIIPLLQLVPLPPEVWRQLPGRGDLTTALKLAGIVQPWAPITLDPESTLQSVLALLPPAALFLSVISSGDRERRQLVSACLIWAVLSIALGAAQLAGGEQSPLYFYNPTNLGLPTGLFSNRNHQAIFLLTALPMATLWVIGDRSRRPISPAVSLALFSLLIVGAIVTRSRAGLLLLGPATAACLVLAWKRDRFGLGGRSFAVIVGVTLVAMLAAAGFLVANVLPRFDLNQTPELRFDTWPQVLAAASNYLPFGSGVGTFQPVYQSVEPLSLVQSAFWNHAHNDYLELWLETGWFGVAIFLGFMVWFVRGAFNAWKLGGDGEDKSLPRAGTIIVGLLLAHSIVDYPIRTEAIASVFALACGLMVARTGVRHGRASRSSPAFRIKQRRAF